MVPSFSIMGINTHFEDMAKKIQNLTSKQELTDEIQDLVIQLEDICIQASEELQEELKIIEKL